MDARSETLQNGSQRIHYDAQTREITDEDHTHAWLLSKHSAALLSLFLKAEHHILTRDEIRFQVWGHDVVSDDVINHAICRLRKQLKQVETPHPFVIETLPGVGYRLTGTDISDDMAVSARRWIVLASLFSLF